VKDKKMLPTLIWTSIYRYFDHGFWGSTKYYNWKTVYLNKLPKNPLVLGGEGKSCHVFYFTHSAACIYLSTLTACMWSEYVDEHSIEVKIWPRLNAVGERLWSDPSDNIQLVESRFNRQRERLIAKGIPVDAILPEYCTIYEGECR
jgi:hexosaminidase